MIELQELLWVLFVDKLIGRLYHPGLIREGSDGVSDFAIVSDDHPVVACFDPPIAPCLNNGRNKRTLRILQWINMFILKQLKT